MKIEITVDTKAIDRWISEYWDYRLHFEGDVMNRLEDEYRCRK